MLIRYKRVTRVAGKKTLAGVPFYPRLEVSGTELADAGFSYGEEVKVTIEKGKVTFELKNPVN
jgi:hypothetical protein